MDDRDRRIDARGTGRRMIAMATVLLTVLLPSRAHEGPPFPIIVDRPVGSMLVSVWTDPDIGTGTFFVIFEPSDGEALPDDIRVDVGVAPVSGRLDEVRYDAESQDVRYGARYYAEVQFDQGEMWKVSVRVTSSAGDAMLTSEVEATPDGTLGPISLILFLLPFLAVGFLWWKAAMRKRKFAAAAASENGSFGSR